MTVLEGIVQDFNNKISVFGHSYDVKNYYESFQIDDFLNILYKSYDAGKSNVQIRSGFDWIYVHIIYLRKKDESIYE